MLWSLPVRLQGLQCTGLSGLLCADYAAQSQSIVLSSHSQHMTRDRVAVLARHTALILHERLVDFALSPRRPGPRTARQSPCTAHPVQRKPPARARGLQPELPPAARVPSHPATSLRGYLARQRSFKVDECMLGVKEVTWEMNLRTALTCAHSLDSCADGGQWPKCRRQKALFSVTHVLDDEQVPEALVRLCSRAVFHLGLQSGMPSEGDGVEAMRPRHQVMYTHKGQALNIRSTRLGVVQT